MFRKNNLTIKYRKDYTMNHLLLNRQENAEVKLSEISAALTVLKQWRLHSDDVQAKAVIQSLNGAIDLIRDAQGKIATDHELNS